MSWPARSAFSSCGRTVSSYPITLSTSGSPAAIFAMALRRTSSLTGTDCQPDVAELTEGGRTRRHGRQPTAARRHPAQAVPTGRYPLAGMDHPGIDLSGTWAATIADESTRRAFFEPSYDDREWEPVSIPGHWRTHEAFAGSDGPLLHRRWFDSPDDGGSGASVRSWLVFDGIFYLGDVWLDGTYLGDTEGYFFPHEFDVTEHVAGRAEHLLAMEVACARQSDRTAKRNLTGVFQHWDCIDPDWNPGGIWRDVRLERTGPVRISRLRLLCRDADPNANRAHFAFVADLDSDEARTVTVRTTIGDLAESSVEQSLAVGVNRVEWTVRVENPSLWWPRAMGDQTLHDVKVEVALGDEVSHRRQVRAGIRSVAMRDWIMSINGERLFLKGSNQGPTRMELGEATSEEVARDVDLAVDAGLDLLRVHAHIGRPELYDRADEAGLLLWQDMPLQWGYARSVRKQAIRQARKSVDLLGHHPSIVIWCGHNVPVAVDVEQSAAMDPKRFAFKYAVGQQLPTFNRSVLDRAVKGAFEKVDGTRPVVAHSGVVPHLPKLDGTDTHVYYGWYNGDERDFARFCAAHPAHGPLRERVRGAGGARRRGVPRSGEVARSRLGTRRPEARAAEGDVRSVRAAGGLRGRSTRGAERRRCTSRRSSSTTSRRCAA